MLERVNLVLSKSNTCCITLVNRVLQLNRSFLSAAVQVRKVHQRQSLYMRANFHVSVSRIRRGTYENQSSECYFFLPFHHKMDVFDDIFSLRSSVWPQFNGFSLCLPLESFAEHFSQCLSASNVPCEAKVTDNNWKKWSYICHCWWQIFRIRKPRLC